MPSTPLTFTDSAHSLSELAAESLTRTTVDNSQGSNAGPSDPVSPDSEESRKSATENATSLKCGTWNEKRLPPSFDEAHDAGLIARSKSGVHTFSNGSEYESWAPTKCERCQFFHPDETGKLCAFEAAAFMSIVSPQLALLFGWTQSTTEHGPLSGWKAPKLCSFLRDVDEPPILFVDPNQIDMFEEIAA